jgi:hypothetical protein
MIIGAPAIVGSIMAINAVTSGGAKKVIINIGGNPELEGSSSPQVASSVSQEGISSSSLFLNKLPSPLQAWLKVLLKYIALYFIIKNIFIYKYILAFNYVKILT